MIKKPLISVFDWDDTLCPTAWLHFRGLLVAHGLINGAPSMEIETFEEKVLPSPLTSSDRQRLELLERQVLELLQLRLDSAPCSSSRRFVALGGGQCRAFFCQECGSSYWTISANVRLRMMSKMYDPMCQYDGGLHLCVSRKEKSNSLEGDRLVENALETLQLVQIDRITALKGPTARDCDARLQQLLVAADSLAHKAHYAGHDHSSYQNEPSLAAVPGVQS
ncbi:hypothetical protein GQ600_16949 [Phytophthora cactorum]|nr:hypothetical protein GQ600_16949 [Phytophthora cactorum]